VFLAGCAGSEALRVVRADAIGPCETSVPESNQLVGVALSGGGSHAALFGTAGLEALAGVRPADGASVIERISHLSSVCGGSIAASYYALRKPGRDVRILDADGAMTEAYRTFFAQSVAAVSQDFETSLIWRQLLSFRWVSPGLIINTTLYNNGRRLALTTLSSAAFDYDFFEDLERSLRRHGRPMEPAPLIRARWKLLRPMTPVEIGIDPCPALLSGAVAGSASFPPLMTFDFSRIPSIMEERATTYQALFFRSLQLEGVDTTIFQHRRPRPHRREVGGGHERSAAGLQGRAGAAPDPRGAAGAHRRDPHAPGLTLGL
jgi:hypothetical protein